MANPNPWVLQRAYAYSIVAEDTEPEGGAFNVNTTMQGVVDNVIRKVMRKKRTVVALQSDAARNCEVRTLVMDFAFASSPAGARSASMSIARRLHRIHASDERTKTSLLMLLGQSRGDEARVYLMLFPKTMALRFRAGKSVNADAMLALVKDAFSGDQAVRKVTEFTGKKVKTAFLQAEVMDWQASGNRPAADYWIHRFLEAKLFLSPQAGSNLLADALRRAMAAATSDEDRDAVSAVITFATRGKYQSTSLQTMADELPAAVRDEFFRGIDPDLTLMEFCVDPAAVRQKAGRRTLEGTDGTRLSAAVGAIGKTVHIERAGDGSRIVRYENVIKSEKADRDDQRRTD